MAAFALILDSLYFIIAVFVRCILIPPDIAVIRRNIRETDRIVEFCISIEILYRLGNIVSVGIIYSNMFDYIKMASSDIGSSQNCCTFGFDVICLTIERVCLSSGRRVIGVLKNKHCEHAVYVHRPRDFRRKIVVILILVKLFRQHILVARFQYNYIARSIDRHAPRGYVEGFFVVIGC